MSTPDAAADAHTDAETDADADRATDAEAATDADSAQAADAADDGPWLPWRAAAERALYGESGGRGELGGDAGDGASAGGGPGTGSGVDKGSDGGGEHAPGGFFQRKAPAAHFRTSVHASTLFAVAVARLLRHVDDALGRPRELTMVDVGAGRGELLTGVLESLPEDVAARVVPYAVERSPRPHGLDGRIVWSHRLPPPGQRAGLLFANEWLDNVPVDVAETDPDGVPRTVLVRPSDGAERLGSPVRGADAEWLHRWWPLPPPHADSEPEHGSSHLGTDCVAARAGLRAEIGTPRDEAWAAAVGVLDRGLAVAADYAHFFENRPPFGTLTGYLEGREVRPVPDGSRDLTAHVAMDACAAAGARAAAERPGRQTADGAAGVAPPAVRTQREALHALGLDGARPPLSLASSDPAAYVRQLASAGEAAELTDRAGLGAFSWLIQPLGGVVSPFG